MTIAIVSFLFGLIMGILFGKISKKFDGMLVVDDSYDESTKWTLDVNVDPKSIPSKKEIRLKVRKID